MRSQAAEFLIWNAAIQRSIDAYWTQPIASGPVCEVCGFTSATVVCVNQRRYDDQFCPLCDVTLDLHDGPDTCASAESKAQVIELFGQGMGWR